MQNYDLGLHGGVGVRGDVLPYKLRAQVASLSSSGTPAQICQPMSNNKQCKMQQYPKQWSHFLRRNMLKSRNILIN
uniref:Uncharacterized protein n=1 Tax=Neogobius melanostomus TaxID=47308 RepID=A0A8C6UPM7_9GOBI